jgi:drug/metabolite transporter (DMT)-like permease
MGQGVSSSTTLLASHVVSLRLRGVLMLLVVTAVWGTTFPFVKTLGETLPSQAIVSARFLIAALVLSPWLRGMDRKRLTHGALLGVVVFASYATQTVGLRSVSSGRAAFVTGLNVIMVPLALPFLGRRLPRVAVVSALLALAGIALMSWDDGALRFGVGDVWVVTCAAFYALYVLLLERFAHQHSALDLSAIQVLVVAICAILWALSSGPRVVLRSLGEADAGTWGTILYLAVIAFALTVLLQTKAQAWVAAPIAVVVYAMEPVFGALASYLWRDERLARLGYLGAALILVAMIVSQREPEGVLDSDGRSALPSPATGEVSYGNTS